MNFDNTMAAIDRAIKMVGTKCTLTKSGGGESSSAIGCLQTSSSRDKADSYVSSNSRVVYLSGKVKIVPEEGDTITFGPNIYAINEVTAYAVGEGSKNVFAYKLTVGTA